MLAAIIQLEMSDHETRAQRLSRVETVLAGMAQAPEKPGLIVLPEIWPTGYFNFDRYIAESEPARGEVLARLAPYAASLGCYLLAGSIVEREEDRCYNAALLIDPSGALAARYRKIHLFGYQSDERRILTAGDTVTVVRTPLGTWGITTCYDLRFPELYRKMVDLGAELFLVPAAWPAARLSHWTLFNRVRALENQCFLLSCNCAGTLRGIPFAGHSAVVDPWGEIVAEAGGEEEILWVRFDPAGVAAARTQFTALTDRVSLF